ncbi:unnamed protein product [Adineta ricciae]|uniref:Uncharacterized protein n=1 Tax=Adineta ricciae TaxID=249248 RepID=A0A816BB28_ADIRI|nr:unnamed protein product [Adineta ricciae]
MSTREAAQIARTKISNLAIADALGKFIQAEKSNYFDDLFQAVTMNIIHRQTSNAKIHHHRIQVVKSLCGMKNTIAVSLIFKLTISPIPGQSFRQLDPSKFESVLIGFGEILAAGFRPKVKRVFPVTSRSSPAQSSQETTETCS